MGWCSIYNIFHITHGGDSDVIDVIWMKTDAVIAGINQITDTNKELSPSTSDVINL